MKYFLRPIYKSLIQYIANHVIAHIPSHSFRLFFYRRLLKINIGSNSSILMGAWFDTSSGLTIGCNTVINQRCRLDNRGGIYVGNNVSISAETCILTGDHDVQDANFEARHRPVWINDYVFIGTRATILPAVTLGTGCVVAVGSVVTKDVAPYTIVAGVPAKPIGVRNSDLRYTLKWMPLLA